MPISIGKPNFVYRNQTMGRSYVQLYFLKGNEVVNLYQGNHPLIELKESEISFDLHYDSRNLQAIDILLSTTIESLVLKMLENAQLTVTQKRRDGLSYSLLAVINAEKIAGLKIDPGAVVHDSWLE